MSFQALVSSKMYDTCSPEELFSRKMQKLYKERNAYDSFWNAFIRSKRDLAHYLFPLMLETVDKKRLAIIMLSSIRDFICDQFAPSVPNDYHFDHVFVIEYMKKAFAIGADINCKDYLGYSVLFLAIKLKSLEVMRFLMSFPECNVNLLSGPERLSPLHYVAMIPSIPMIELLLNHGCNIETTATKHHLTPLIYCVSKDYRDFMNNSHIVSVLLEKGACMYPDKVGKSAVSYAISSRNPRILEVLLRNGAPSEYNEYPDPEIDSLLLHAPVFHKEQEQTAVALVNPLSTDTNTRFEAFLDIFIEG